MTLELEYQSGQTPLDEDERRGLRDQSIRTVAQLNEAEAINISAALTWLQGRRRVRPLASTFLRELHRRMFGGVWRWAGTYRHSDKNIGVHWHEIPIRLEQWLQDVTVQLEHEAYSHDELAARYHHRLVAIHAFPNGNGRHARLACDLLLTQILGGNRFTWGADNLVEAGPVRARYIEALRRADGHDYAPLLAFVRS